MGWDNLITTESDPLYQEGPIPPLAGRGSCLGEHTPSLRATPLDIGDYAQRIESELAMHGPKGEHTHSSCPPP